VSPKQSHYYRRIASIEEEVFGQRDGRAKDVVVEVVGGEEQSNLGAACSEVAPVQTAGSGKGQVGRGGHGKVAACQYAQRRRRYGLRGSSHPGSDQAGAALDGGLVRRTQASIALTDLHQSHVVAGAPEVVNTERRAARGERGPLGQAAERAGDATAADV